MAQVQGQYYIPHGSHWPVLATISIGTMMIGGATWLNGAEQGPFILAIGAAILLVTLFGWFGTVINESESGTYNDQVDHSFRWGMVWFIFSEVMFFGGFFLALFYARVYALPWLGGHGEKGVVTNYFLWPDFVAMWPQTANGPGHVGGHFEAMSAWGIAAINTLILLTSSVTVTWAHWGVKKNRRWQLILGLVLTIALGWLFVGMQAYEYHEAYTEMGLTLGTGVYGSTFFLLTGFHGLHVTIGSIILVVMLARSIWGHFSPHHHFAFEASSWYWHFVDVVWLCLFIFVYWL